MGSCGGEESGLTLWWVEGLEWIQMGYWPDSVGSGLPAKGGRVEVAQEWAWLSPPTAHPGPLPGGWFLYESSPLAPFFKQVWLLMKPDVSPLTTSGIFHVPSPHVKGKVEWLTLLCPL